MVVTWTLLICLIYRIVGKFGRDKLWRICSFWAFGGKKFGEWIDRPIGLSTIWLVLIWRIRRFAKFAKLSPRQTFPLYGMLLCPQPSGTYILGQSLILMLQLLYNYPPIFSPYINCLHTLAMCMYTGSYLKGYSFKTSINIIIMR